MNRADCLNEHCLNRMISNEFMTTEQVGRNTWIRLTLSGTITLLLNHMGNNICYCQYILTV